MYVTSEENESLRLKFPRNHGRTHKKGRGFKSVIRRVEPHFLLSCTQGHLSRGICSLLDFSPPLDLASWPFALIRDRER